MLEVHWYVFCFLRGKKKRCSSVLRCHKSNNKSLGLIIEEESWWEILPSHCDNKDFNYRLGRRKQKFFSRKEIAVGATVSPAAFCELMRLIRETLNERGAGNWFRNYKWVANQTIMRRFAQSITSASVRGLLCFVSTELANWYCFLTTLALLCIAGENLERFLFLRLFNDLSRVACKLFCVARVDKGKWS